VTKAEKAVLAIVGAASLACVFVVAHAAQDVLRPRPVAQNVLQASVDSLQRELDATQWRVNRTMERCGELYEKALAVVRQRARSRR